MICSAAVPRVHTMRPNKNKHPIQPPSLSQRLFYLSVPIRRSCQPLATLITVPLVQSTGSPRGCPTRLSSLRQLPCPQMLPQFLSLTEDVSPHHIWDTLPSNLLRRCRPQETISPAQGAA